MAVGRGGGSLPDAVVRGQPARRGCERAACPARLREGSLPSAAVRGQLARCGSEGGAACLDCENLAMAQCRCCMPAPCGGLHRPVCLLTC